jgi:hypothetical protein
MVRSLVIIGIYYFFSASSSGFSIRGDRIAAKTEARHRIVKRRDVRTALASAFTLAANKSTFGFLSKRQTICRVSLPHSSKPLFLAQRPSILDAAPCKSSARGNDEPSFATRVLTESHDFRRYFSPRNGAPS